MVASNGYVLVRVGVDHHLADCRGYAYEHRLVAEATLGRRLHPHELVHHIDHDKQNNAPANLRVEPSRAYHRFEHRRLGSNLRLPGEVNPTVPCACGCGTVLERFDESGRPRRFVSGHNPQDSQTQDAILSVLSNGPLHRSEIAYRINKTVRTTAVALSKLGGKERVVRLGRGEWRLS